MSKYLLRVRHRPLSRDNGSPLHSLFKVKAILLVACVFPTVSIPVQGGGAGRSNEGAGVPRHDGFNPTLLILVIVVGLVALFLVGNVVMYYYAQSVLPPKKKKPLSKKKMMKERMKRGVAAPGE